MPNGMYGGVRGGLISTYSILWTQMQCLSGKMTNHRWTKRLPCVKGADAVGGWGIVLNKTLTFYNPSVTASRATSLCTREAFFYLPEGSFINFTKYIYKPQKMWYNKDAKQNQITFKDKRPIFVGGLISIPILRVRLNQAKMLAPLTCIWCLSVKLVLFGDNWS